MAPKRGRPARKSIRNITNPELNQGPPVNTESNPDPQVNLETNTAPPVNPGANPIPLAGASGSESNEAMIARIVREQLSACGVLIPHQPHIASGSGGDHTHTEHNATGGNTETHRSTGTTTTIRGMVTAAEPTTLKRAILLTTKLTDEAVRSGMLVTKTQTAVGRSDVDSMREMMNVSENGARNGVTDCPESRNEVSVEKRKKLPLGGLLTFRSHPETLRQVQIIFISAEILQIRATVTTR
ncbi:hypothetical protein E3N88_01559 [Mikania micrantha]|uniref:Uncharacterized protein n=1 Tax=Mikania micrantha TaxID=192012 RepID=A0A5N6Q1X3_9ASTR|nr:hypothetical protein E3N88_01559 [Mikania micrantha]